jgi:hypothetical protein
MPLPKITQPTFEFVLPSSNKKVKMRPMLVKEEKILLVAKLSGERYDSMNAIRQVVNNCIITEGVDIDSMPIFDLEYLFLKLRTISVSNISKVSYKDSEDDKQYDIDVNLDEVKVDMKNAPETKITVNKDIMMELSWPSVAFYCDKAIYEADDSKAFDLMVDNCLSKVYQGDQVFDAKTSSVEERREFVDSLPAKVADELRKFMAGVPTLKHQISYKNSKGTERKITLDTLDDFFTF